MSGILLGRMQALFAPDLLRREKSPYTRQLNSDPARRRQRATALLQGQVRLFGNQLQYHHAILA
jgi:hypothetical protein